MKVFTVTRLSEYIDEVEECVWYKSFTTLDKAKEAIESSIKQAKLDNNLGVELVEDDPLTWIDYTDHSILNDQYHNRDICITRTELIK